MKLSQTGTFWLGNGTETIQTPKFQQIFLCRTILQLRITDECYEYGEKQEIRQEDYDSLVHSDRGKISRHLNREQSDSGQGNNDKRGGLVNL